MALFLVQFSINLFFFLKLDHRLPRQTKKHVDFVFLWLDQLEPHWPIWANKIVILKASLTILYKPKPSAKHVLAVHEWFYKVSAKISQKIPSVQLCVLFSRSRGRSLKVLRREKITFLHWLFQCLNLFVREWIPNWKALITPFVKWSRVYFQRCTFITFPTPKQQTTHTENREGYYLWNNVCSATTTTTLPFFSFLLCLYKYPNQYNFVEKGCKF